MPDELKLPIVVIACRVFQNFIENYIPDGLRWEITFMDYGLHRVPRNLKKALQEKIDGIEQPSLVVLGYGLCGNGLHGLKAGKHVLLAPRADDCIAILLGSYKAYREQFDGSPGTYYLTKGWLESGSNPLEEYKEILQRYDQRQADWLMDEQYKNYKRLVLVAHKLEDLEKYRPRAEEVARYCERWGMHYEEILGSDCYARKLIETALRLEKADEDFVVAPPGGELKQSQFLRW
jgi:hypothetical protein